MYAAATQLNPESLRRRIGDPVITLLIRYLLLVSMDWLSNYYIRGMRPAKEQYHNYQVSSSLNHSDTFLKVSFSQEISSFIALQNGRNSRSHRDSRDLRLHTYPHPDSNCCRTSRISKTTWMDLSRHLQRRPSRGSRLRN